MGLTIAVAGVVVALLVAAWLNRRTIAGLRVRARERLARPVILTRGSLGVLMALVGIGLAATIVTSALNRRELSKEREARLEAVTAQLTDRADLMRVKRDLERYARRQAALASPSTRELARRSRMALVACARSASCRTSFTRVVNQVLRVSPGGQLVPAPPPLDRDGETGRAPQNTPSAPPPPPSAAVPGEQGPQGPPGQSGRPGRDVDSSIVDGLDNRVADLEQGLARILGRLGVLDAVCRLLPAACR